MMLMRTDPFRDFDRLTQQVLGTPSRPAAMPIDAYRAQPKPLKKWLSYRERAVMSRGLSVEEVREFTNNTRRIVSILLFQPQLDKNYQAVKSATPA